eukprot:CAMPEP_0115667514 /NCGR_PEP_ID=MMETSP0272-20121206/49981_1 /TAXON_ID=71861 /ORGANISM="Scrippsiella trochoidea, Strain CCMP3099" /LENGTH=45 /DNA_ID= /DNA_START= /DNA_END= /DNA_ORIENTATION=
MESDGAIECVLQQLLRSEGQHDKSARPEPEVQAEDQTQQQEVPSL